MNKKTSWSKSGPKMHRVSRMPKNHPHVDGQTNLVIPTAPEGSNATANSDATTDGVTQTTLATNKSCDPGKTPAPVAASETASNPPPTEPISTPRTSVPAPEPVRKNTIPDKTATTTEGVAPARPSADKPDDPTQTPTPVTASETKPNPRTPKPAPASDALTQAANSAAESIDADAAPTQTTKKNADARPRKKRPKRYRKADATPTRNHTKKPDMDVCRQESSRRSHDPTSHRFEFRAARETADKISDLAERQDKSYQDLLAALVELALDTLRAREAEGDHRDE